MSLAKFSVENSVLINMIMIVVFIFGLFTLQEIPKEKHPPVDFGSFIIFTMYPGTSPSEMEELITIKIEEEIADVENIDFIMSTSSEGRSVVMVRFEPYADIDKAQSDLSAELDKVTDLPEDAEDPYLWRLNMREVDPIGTIVLGGDFSGNAFREIAENLQDELLDINFVSKVEIHGTREREIWVEGDSYKLDEYGLSLSDISSAIQMRNMNMPGGTIDFGKVEFLLRSIGEFESTSEINELTIRMDENGRAIRLRDVATVRDTLEEQTVVTALDGQPSVTLYVYKKAAGNIIRVMEEVHQRVNSFAEGIPGLEASIKNDGSIEVRNSLQTLGSSATFGIVLVFVTLFFFLGWRNALFAALGIPFSFLLTFIMMHYLDMSLNTLSLFGLVLVLGMIVDDAIMVLENVHRWMEKGLPPKEAAIKGAQEIMWPVIAAVATTAVAFLPMLMMEGMLGKFMSVLPIVVTLALTASLIESLVILPSHIADYTKPLEKRKVERKRIEFFLRRYRRTLVWALKHRIAVFIFVFLLFLGAMGAVGMRLIKFEFFPSPLSRTIMLQLKTPVGTNLEETGEVVDQIEDYIETMPEHKDVESLVSTVGLMVVNHRWEEMSNNAEIRIDLREIDQLEYSHDEIKNSIRTFLEDLPGLKSYKFTEIQEGPPTGADIELRINGESLERLEFIGGVVKDELRRIPGVEDIEDDFDPGKDELQIIPDQDKLGLYGLSAYQVASTLRTASYGSTVSKYRGEGIDEYDIIVRMKENQIETIDQLANLKIRTPSGVLVTLKDIAEIRNTSSLATIKHRDEERVITITAANGTYMENGQQKRRSTDEVTVMLFGDPFRGTEGRLSNFSQRFPGYGIESGGVAERQAESYGSLVKAFGVAILLVFTILAAQFKSYVQPLIVMMTIPFAFIGVVFGLFVTGLPFSLTTLVAVVALAGVVVNDSLVLVDFVNRLRLEGKNRWESLITAGCIRLRPIILTTVTTIFGLMPMILSTSLAAAEWKPMAVSIAFGLGFATVLTLFVIPIIYSFVDSIFGALGMTRFKSHIKFADAIAQMGDRCGLSASED